LCPLFEASTQRLLKTDVLPASARDEHTWSRVFVEAHCALGSEDDEDEDVLAPGDDASLLYLSLRTTFAMAVPLSGASTSNDRYSYVEFIKRTLADPRGPVRDRLSNTWWKKSRATADRMFAILTFFVLWQGPTQADAFWPTWVGNTPPPVFQVLDEDAVSMEEQLRRDTALVVHRLARETKQIYEDTTNARHPRRFLLDRLIHYLHGLHSAPVYGFLMAAGDWGHSAHTANGLVYSRAKEFCFRQCHHSPVTSIGGSGGNNLNFNGHEFLQHAYGRDRVLLEEVLDFGRDAVRYRSEY
jgi:hypothetical protein